ncbi:MAG: hypothetical protein ACK2UM_06450 [Anaerolineales bacterium]|jgi:hypothetical protein
MKTFKGLIVLFVFSSIIVSCSQPGTKEQAFTAQNILAETGQKEWDLIVWGDSDMDPAYMFYSDYFEEDLGIKIVTHIETDDIDFIEIPDALEDQDLRDLIKDGDIIAFNIPIVRPSTGGACFDIRKDLINDGCFDVSLDEFTETTQRTIQEIKSLVGEKGAMIRLQNSYVPLKLFEGTQGSEDRSQGCFECFAEYFSAQAEIATEEGIPLVDVFTLFHGENHQQDPYEKGYISADNIHVNRPGAEEIAKLYRQVGYEYWKP